MNFKRILVIGFALVIGASLFSGCVKKSEYNKAKMEASGSASDATGSIGVVPGAK